MNRGWHLWKSATAAVHVADIFRYCMEYGVYHSCTSYIQQQENEFVRYITTAAQTCNPPYFNSGSTLDCVVFGYRNKHDECNYDFCTL